MDSQSNISLLLNQVGQGDASAKEQLFQVVYSQLILLAEKQMGQERRDHTLIPPALVNEAYFKLESDIGDMENRRQFYGAAVNAMRQVLIDHARQKNAAKRRNVAGRVPLDAVIDQLENEISCSVLDLDQAVTELSMDSDRQGRIIEMRFFASMELADIAMQLDCSVATVKRELNAAKSKLARLLDSNRDTTR